MLNQNLPDAFISAIAKELSLPTESVAATIRLLNDGNTIPFIARYRKEATGNLDEVQIKCIQERNSYLHELEERKLAILSSIETQGKLTSILREQILACTIKTALEDLYLPFKPKRRTRAMIAREKGLEPLAGMIMEQPLKEKPETAAISYVNRELGVEDIESALAGARDIAAEKIAENANARAFVRDCFANDGIVISKVRTGKDSQPTKFEQYYDFKESVRSIPSHRYLAIRRGEREEILDFSIEIEPFPVIAALEKMFGLNASSPFHEQLKLAIEDAFQRLIAPGVETDVRLDLKMSSDRASVSIFADNLRNLLLASPMGASSVIGIDPGIRTGCKCAVVDATGKYLESATLYLAQGEQSILNAKKELKRLVELYNPHAIAIGNGTAGRETEAFVRRFLKEIEWASTLVVSVNEAGASVYSASDTAREEFPDLDITIRGAVSIARRLQDPLAELVKIDPKSIGVGQYQHDVHQPLLQDELQHVVESCVNQVGVDLNTASYSLLNYVSGIGPSLARKIVKHRETNGPFKKRGELLGIAGFGPKTFEQAAGFLRIRGGEYPLDASAVHPERYDFVEGIAKDLRISLTELIGNPQMLSRLDFSHYAGVVGDLTLADIIQELKKPGRDPRACFEPPSFREDILSIDDLKPGMRLEGIVTNVTAFGAFVDLGVHQDGLIHLSEISDQYIQDPRSVVKTGDKIKVAVLQIDLPRKRISLTARIGMPRKSADPFPLSKQSTGKSKPPSGKTNFNSNPFEQL